MKVLSYKDSEYTSFVATLDRRAIPEKGVEDLVSDIIANVKENGNQAVYEYTKKFDHLHLTDESLFVSADELAEAAASVDDDVKAAIEASRQNIHDFSRRSFRQNWSAENAQGVTFGERFTPYDRIAAYVPGGKAPLVSSALMTAAFAQAAGVKEIIAATPAGADGKVNPALLYALQQSGATEIIKVGGAQAIAALALGTQTVRPVEKIFGPGNSFVVEAKRQLVGAVSIDLLPGPSEVLIIADDSAVPEFIAADMLAQAEHGGDSIVGFVTTSDTLIAKVDAAIQDQLKSLSRANYMQTVLDNSTFCLQAKDLDEAMEICNAFAPEHLSLIVENEDSWLEKVKTAGAIYVGNMAAVAVGDFLAGPSHTLPTGGSGKSFSGIRADQFQRRTSIVRMDQAAVKKSVDHVETFARVEGLDAHGQSVRLRADA
ncbi:histidinol dehydrogenase [Persicirhabdus sediminis]|uniref:Histidinol dehydrogenase n=1 Tax=Persicirhabdus sediminis TaxID=454144 RepID=A0A8J7SHD6_9BACT|nr:histidinol dehydrogenase [Persicirhabdus sediminis]MBK1790725.1 histidinol dehydrogenase [Persicirhabdus sediminis]